MLRWLLPAAVLLLIALIVIPGFLQKWLWMRQLGYASIFWTLVSVKVALACVAFAFLFLWVNLREASKSRTKPVDPKTESDIHGSSFPNGTQTGVIARHVASRSSSLLVAAVAAIFAQTPLRYGYL